MAIEDVKKLTSTDNVTEANAYLQSGWILLAVTPGRMEDGTPWTWHTLGWARDDQPVYPDNWPR